MYLREIYKKDKKIISFEVFPPRNEYDISKLFDTIEDLRVLKPDFVSVTYGAGGGTREKTVEIASRIKNQMRMESVAHFTCVNSTKDDILKVLYLLKENNINNILALRGDPPIGEKDLTSIIGGFNYAYELVRFIKKHDDWSIAVAGYPEGHPRSENLDKDIDYLKLKVDCGADVIITQLFLDNRCFYRFRDLAVKNGINIPIIPGIFPVLNFKAFDRITELSRASIPDDLYKNIEKVKDSIEETRRVGIEYAIKQSEDLLSNDVKGLHFYTMNKSAQIKKIVSSLASYF